MRVIEPPRQPAFKKPTKPSRLTARHKRLLSSAVIVFVLLGGLAWWIDRTEYNTLFGLFQNQSSAEIARPQQPTIQTYTAEQFKNLYNTFAYPNTQEITLPPAITTNVAADTRIRTIAEELGYSLRSVPVAPISKTREANLEGDDLLQPLALADWQDLEKAAGSDGIPLRLLSGYRSIEYQRELFSERLVAAGAYTADIANGLADAKIKRVLATTAPPGYSRHHTGYTIDVACYPNRAFVPFKDSSCFNWIKADNYTKAKAHGFIPSYPEGTTKQGPEPESWEYVWVGRDTLVD